ncbi:transposon Ty3-I Gag-Pol polyprotein [Trichonephila clavipes]|nr:transposon Ty3-I Gag-Pol polyprotein [Trichonephila clavipes]
MPTEQEAKPAVVTPSLQQWRSPSTFRGAPGEDPLKWLKEYDRTVVCQQRRRLLDSWEAFKNGLSGLFGDRQKYTRRAEEQLKCRAQRSGESTQSYIQSVLDFAKRERLSFDNSLETADGTSTTLALKKKYADQTLLAVFTPSPTRGRSPIRRYSPRRHIADPVSRQAVGARKTKESDLPRSHDVILGWDFLEASQAVIDCGQNELVLEDICRDSTAPDAWNLYATRDYTLKPHSLTRITVSGYQTRGDINSSRRQQTFALRENIATPSMVSTYRNGKSDVWVTNLQFRNQIIPRGMCIGQAEPLNEGHLCVISDTSDCLDDQQETSESQMNCSLMMSPELSDEQRNKHPNYSEIFWAFHEDRQVDSRKDECETQDFTGDHAPINQRAYRVSPTERRIIHEEVQKMLDEGIVQPSESPWSSPIVLVEKRR